MFIHHLDSPSEAVQLAAVRQHGSYIAFIDKPTELVQLTALKNWLAAAADIKDPCEAAQLIIVEHGLFRAVRQLAPDVQQAYDLTRALGFDWHTAGFSAALRAAYAGLKNQAAHTGGASENPGLT